MNASNVPTAGLLLAMMFACSSAVLAGENEQAPPNILFIFSDDHSYHDAGAYGNDEVATPHIDRLADQGALFTRVYNMGSYSPAVCIASRTMLNTGKFLWRAESADRERFQRERKLWSQQMADAGYRTYFAGKWHVPGVDVEQVFDTVRNVRPGMPRDYSQAQAPDAYDRPIEGEADTWDAADPTLGGFWAGGTHWSEVTADDAQTMLADAAEHDEPFFMYLAFNAPHDPRQSPRDYLDRYPEGEVRLPESYLPEYPYKNPIGVGRVDRNRPHSPGTPQEEIDASPYLRDEALAPFPRTEHAVRVHRQEYYGIISHMDSQIGRVLDALEESGELENTWIVYTSDHGLAVGHHGMLGKQNMYEHSLRVPFIVVAPGVEAGRTIEAPIYLQDLVPTTLELAGADVPNHVQFRSILPLLQGEREQSYEAIYGGYLDHQRAIVYGRHKLILYPTIGKVRLFDLVDDPHEIHDLADDPAHRSRIRDLMDRLKQLQQETGDELDLTQAYPGWF